MGLMETVIDIPAEHEANVFGQFDSHIKKIEQTEKSTLPTMYCYLLVFVDFFILHLLLI